MVQRANNPVLAVDVQAGERGREIINDVRIRITANANEELRKRVGKVIQAIRGAI